MPWGGSANIDEPGVTIDLGFLNTTTLSEDKQVAHVGPGSRWGPVYDTLSPDGLVVVGGRSEHVGVGGYLLGGKIPQPISLLPLLTLGYRRNFILLPKIRIRQ